MKNDMYLKKFCCNTKYIRKYHKLSQKEMAKRLHIGIYSLRKIERGEIPIRLGVDVLFHFYEAFHITPNQMLAADISRYMGI